jgi:hypothetical protein
MILIIFASWIYNPVPRRFAKQASPLFRIPQWITSAGWEVLNVSTSKSTSTPSKIIYRYEQHSGGGERDTVCTSIPVIRNNHLLCQTASS